MIDGVVIGLVAFVAGVLVTLWVDNTLLRKEIEKTLQKYRRFEVDRFLAFLEEYAIGDKTLSAEDVREYIDTVRALREGRS